MYADHVFPGFVVTGDTYCGAQSPLFLKRVLFPAVEAQNVGHPTETVPDLTSNPLFLVAASDAL